jgi:fructose-1-phosphate kinase PfkB-like protein
VISDMIITVTLKAALDRIITVPALNLGDVTRSEGTFDYPGGKGINVSRALIRLGYGATTATGFLGGSVGQIVADYLAEEGIRSAFVHTASPSAIDIQLDETEAGRVSAIYERGPEVTPEEIDALRRQFDGLVKEAELCVFAGRAPCPALNTLFAEFINPRCAPPLQRSRSCCASTSTSCLNCWDAACSTGPSRQPR